MDKLKVKLIGGGVVAPAGFKAAGVTAGIKASGKSDMALILSERPAKAAALFTTNKFAAAPVILSRENIEGGIISAAIINSGNANACTGEVGLKDAQSMASGVAKAFDLNPKEIVVASTGVIGLALPMDKINLGIDLLVDVIERGGNELSAEAIMTTDTFQKEIAISFRFRGKEVKMGGMAKGSGMIAPNMATMLAFITTDINICRTCLKAALAEVVASSFNMITVDGECSTNDMVLVMASGLAGNDKLILTDPDYPVFLEALSYVAKELAKMIVKDGEGMTKFIEIEVKGAKEDAQAKLAAMAVANSLLVKTAFFGEDANWGRIVSAIGHSGAEVDPSKVDIDISGFLIVSGGVKSHFDEGRVLEALKEKELKISIDLGLLDGKATVWTCDLSDEYIKINAEYRT